VTKQWETIKVKWGFDCPSARPHVSVFLLSLLLVRESFYRCSVLCTTGCLFVQFPHAALVLARSRYATVLVMGLITVSIRYCRRHNKCSQTVVRHRKRKYGRDRVVGVRVLIAASLTLTLPLLHKRSATVRHYTWGKQPIIEHHRSKFHSAATNGPSTTGTKVQYK
jgi:hypothetical protein